jgi:hypothetical protein
MVIHLGTIIDQHLASTDYLDPNLSETVVELANIEIIISGLKEKILKLEKRSEKEGLSKEV